MKLTKIIALLKTELRLLITPRTLILLFAPALIAMLSVLSMPADLLKTGALVPFPAAVTSEGENGFADELIFQALEGVNIFSEIIRCTREEADALLERGEVCAAFHIPGGLEEALVYRRPAEIGLSLSEKYPLQGSAARSLAQSVVKSLAAAQAAVYSFHETMLGRYGDDMSKLYEAENGFALSVLAEVLQRGRYLSVIESGYVIETQFVMLFLLISCGSVAVFGAHEAADRLQSGAVKRMRLGGASLADFAAARLILDMFLSVVSFAFLWVLLSSFAGLAGLSFIKLAAGALLISVMLSPPCLAAAFLTASSRQTAIISFVFILLILLAGGAVYPLYLLGPLQALGSVTPGAYALKLALWAGGGVFDLGALYCAAVMLLFVPASILIRRGRGALC